MIAAESALKSFIQLKDGALLIKSHVDAAGAGLDFTSDEVLNDGAVGGGGGGAAANGNDRTDLLICVPLLLIASAPEGGLSCIRSFVCWYRFR